MSDELHYAQSGRSGLDEYLAGSNARWPIIKFLSLSLYSAWILLTMTTPSAVAQAEIESPAIYSSLLYLLSGVALAACLFLCGIFCMRLQPWLKKRWFVLGAGLIAGMGTYLLSGGAPGEHYGTLFPVGSVLTGLGTAFVCLKIGCVYAEMYMGNPFVITIASVLLSNLVFFLCMGVPPDAQRVLIALLPAGASLLTWFDVKNPRHASTLEKDLIPIESLPTHLFLRLNLTIFLMCVAVGAIRGMAGLVHPAEGWTPAVIVFASMVAWGIGLVAFSIAFTLRNFEISSVYLPAALGSAAVIAVCSLFGSNLGPLVNVVANVGYNVFIIVVWCLLQDLASRTTLNPVRVFGFGRGSSGAGTTLGWLASFIIFFYGTSSDLLPLLFVISALLVLASGVLMRGSFTISQALQRTLKERRRVDASDEQKRAAEQDEVEASSLTIADPLAAACAQLAEEMGLTTREAEAMELLGRGRTVGYVAEELGISYNTVKGYVKNVYAKCGVHSRQDLISAIEKRWGG
ncbi:helix-turn-helix transcriptional regulator [Adlercreutzia sp. ZJ473]|uniref:helix-turn-helix transcriptional regulator n=1 Tax=Adlercreutzia sp. ZJ473 TaxID=2722822 RepID=UPI001551BF6B|nr:LuxR C-terminal-related transcriptional regulator [Adlercreutzia sp. ZJ473]